MISARWLLVLGAAMTLLLSGCGNESGGETVTGETQKKSGPTYLQVNLPGKVGPEEAGFLLASRLGYFSQAKLNVGWITPSHPARPPRYVEEELVNAAIVRGPQLIFAREDGKPLVAIGSLIPRPTMAMIWLDGSGIEGIADLKGKTIAIPGLRFQKLFLEAVLERAGLTLADVKLKSVGNFLESELIQGKADAIFGGSTNTEGKLLEEQGLKPVATPVTKLGVPDYDELIMVARRDRYAEDPDGFQRLVEETARGGAEVPARPGAATRAIIKHRRYENSSHPNRPLHPQATRAGVEEIAPRFSHTGAIDRAKLERLIEWMHEEGMIGRRWQVSELLASP